MLRPLGFPGLGGRRGGLLTTASSSAAHSRGTAAPLRPLATAANRRGGAAAAGAARGALQQQQQLHSQQQHPQQRPRRPAGACRALTPRSPGASPASSAGSHDAGDAPASPATAAPDAAAGAAGAAGGPVPSLLSAALQSIVSGGSRDPDDALAAAGRGGGDAAFPINGGNGGGKNGGGRNGSSNGSRGGASVRTVMAPLPKGGAPPPPPPSSGGGGAEAAAAAASADALAGAASEAVAGAGGGGGSRGGGDDEERNGRSLQSLEQEEPGVGGGSLRRRLLRGGGGGSSSGSLNAATATAPPSPPPSPGGSPTNEIEEVPILGAVWTLLNDREDLVTLFYAMTTGVVVATSVFFFDVSIQYIHDLPDIFAQTLHLGGGRATGLQLPNDVSIPFRCVMPVAAGFAVAALQSKGFAPGLKFLTRAIEGVVDDSKTAALPKDYWQVFRKAAASAITLGSGASLGPEAPSVELGANTAAVLAPKRLSKRRQRMLVAAGAAAGVSAAFDAPTSGALFAVEFVLKSSRLGLDRLSTSTVFASTSVAAGVVGFLRSEGRALGIAGASQHLVGRIPYFSVQPNLLIDVLQFSALGVACAGAAVLLYEGVRVSETALRPLPRWAGAPLGGAICGVIAFRFPQVQFGYTSLEEIFRDESRASVGDLTSLLFAKIAATSVCAGAGLVGGLFQPSLFLGALVGDIASRVVGGPWGVVDPTTFTVVGAAAVLGAACRAPLTAIALMVEITRDVGLLVPLLAAIGVASVVSEYGEGVLGTQLDRLLAQGFLAEAYNFWGATANVAGPAPPPAPQVRTVEEVICTPARLYVRHTLPLEQAKTALASRNSPAAVVVDDNFSPMGLVYLEDIEAELVKEELLNQADSNFNREPFL